MEKEKKTSFDEMEVKKAVARGNYARNTSEWLLDKINATRFLVLDGKTKGFPNTLEDGEEQFIECDLMLQELKRIYTIACRLHGLLTEDEYIMLEPTEEE